VLARVEWPGKPGGAAAATPLTPIEQRRFTAGQEVYKNLCEACHGADGREQQGVAPALIGSAEVVGPAAVPIRILLHGKEGSVGLMPAHADALGDEEIAAVITYIRRSWGHTASPVDAGAVKNVRSATAGRTRPWTAEELAAIR
jgi:mono/diheme cytochrome c family protein